MQISALVVLLAATAFVFAVEANAGDRGYSVEQADTFHNDSSVDKDGPQQDPKYDEDDPKWDELDNSVNEEGDDE